MPESVTADEVLSADEDVLSTKQILTDDKIIAEIVEDEVTVDEDNDEFLRGK